MASGTSGICLSPAFPPKAVSGVEIYSPDRGIYQIKEKENSHPVLKDFTTLMPEKRISPKCIYIHEDGSLFFNGKLNQEIKSREVEIRLHMIVSY